VERGAFGDQRFMSRMTGGEIADVAVRSYQALAWTFLRRTIVPTLFCVAAWLFVARFSSDLFDSHKTVKSEQVTELFFKLALCLGAALPMFLIGVSWVTAIITGLASDWMLDRVPDGNVASRRAVQMLPRMAAATIREALLALGGSLISLLLLFFSSLIPVKNDTTGAAAIIALLGVIGIIVGVLIAIYVVVIHSLIPSVLMIEGLRPGKAAKRSRQLVSAADSRKQNPGQVALILLGGVVILAVFGTLGAWSTFESLADVSEHIKTWMPGTVFNVGLGYAWDLVPVFLILWIVMPIWCLGTVAVYYSTRVRIEGYDIDLLATEVWQRDKRSRFEI
jgi:hypothetical protein